MSFISTTEAKMLQGYPQNTRQPGALKMNGNPVKRVEDITRIDTPLIILIPTIIFSTAFFASMAALTVGGLAFHNNQAIMTPAIYTLMISGVLGYIFSLFCSFSGYERDVKKQDKGYAPDIYDHEPGHPVNDL